MIVTLHVIVIPTHFVTSGHQLRLFKKHGIDIDTDIRLLSKIDKTQLLYRYKVLYTNKCQRTAFS